MTDQYPSAEYNMSKAAFVLASQNAYNSQEMFFIYSGSLVFFMQAGFSMLEAGSVSRKSTLNILFKNMMDAGIGALSWWLIGYAIAFGDGSSTNGSFAGGTKFGLNDISFTDISTNVAEKKTGEYSMWFFQFTFAATGATIVSGAVAERTALSAYLIYSIFITAFIYPVVVFWGWNGGFNKSWAAAGFEQGASDFAGSGIVHMVGGTAGLIGAIVIGPRKGRFTEPNSAKFKPHNMTLSALGTIILWFGWYGFNCGSGSPAIAGKVAATTTISAAAACCTGVILAKLLYKTWDVAIGLNSILAGLVSITAGANVVEPWGAFMSGVIGAIFYLISSYAMKAFQIDDPLDAFSIHGVCGLWGLLAVGIFGTASAFKYATGEDGGCNTTGGCGSIFLANLCFGLSILLWTGLTSFIIFGGLRKLGNVFPSTLGKDYPYFEPEQGIDAVEHGGRAYIFNDVEKASNNNTAAVTTVNNVELSMDVTADEE